MSDLQKEIQDLEKELERKRMDLLREEASKMDEYRRSLPGKYVYIKEECPQKRIAECIGHVDDVVCYSDVKHIKVSILSASGSNGVVVRLMRLPFDPETVNYLEVIDEGEYRNRFVAFCEKHLKTIKN